MSSYYRKLTKESDFNRLKENVVIVIVLFHICNFKDYFNYVTMQFSITLKIAHRKVIEFVPNAGGV